MKENILSAYQKISPFIVNTPLIKSDYLSNLTNSDVYLKLENLQTTGSFKLRGALNKIFSNPNNNYFVTASTGNHALGFAKALQLSNKNGVVFLPENAKKNKIEQLKQYNVDLKFYGNDCVNTELFAKKYALEKEAVWVSPYNDEAIIYGQGTIGKEITDCLDNFDNIFVCVGGGGLISGVAGWIKSNHLSTKIFACQPFNSPEMSISIKKGKIVKNYINSPTLSDASAGGIETNSITFDYCKLFVDDFLLAKEEEIKQTILAMLKHQKILIEGAAAVPVACLINNKEQFKNKKNVVIVCGGNIDIKLVKEWM